MNDPRMSQIGRQVVTRSLSPLVAGRTDPVYPFWKPKETVYTPPPQAAASYFQSPEPRKRPLLRAREVVTDMQQQLQSLESQMESKHRTRAAQRLLTDMNSMLTAYETRRSPQKAPSTAQPSGDLGRVLEFMERQQEQVFALVRDMREPAARSEAPADSTASPLATGKPSPNPGPQSPLHPIEDRYQRVKHSPEEFKKLLQDVSADTAAVRVAAVAPSVGRHMNLLARSEILRRIRLERQERDRQRNKQTMKPLAVFRAVGIAVLFPIFAYSSFLNRKRRERANNAKVMADTMEVFYDKAKTWVLRAIRTPITSLLNDEELDLDVVTKLMAPKDATPDEISARPHAKVLKIQVRVKGIIEGLKENTNKEDISIQLRSFVDKLVSNEAYMPQSYLVGFESSRIDRDGFGAIRNQTMEKKELLISFFFITRIIVKDILLRVSARGLVLKPSTRSEM